jgi:hypothetical protein
MNLYKSIFNRKDIISISKKWKIKELAVFGSVLRDDFTQDSDIDILIQFEANTHYSLFDLVDLKDELEQALGRSVDLVEKSSITNPFRKDEILRTAKIIFPSRKLTKRYLGGKE